MPDETPSTPAGQWPDASLWPSDDDPPIVWARFYRDHCGWIVLPTASRLDVLSHASSIARKEAASYALDSTGSINGDIPDEVADLISDRAREEAEAGFGRPIGYIYKAWMAKVVTASDITDDMLREAWEPVEHSRGPRAEADTRGIAIVPGRSSKGLPVCLVDVDVGHGDSPAGDVNGPWGWGLPGPKASTPRGGLHTLMLSTGKETASADLGPGIDVVASGTPIPLPAGSATPGRRWLRKDAPVVAPDDLRRRGRKKKPPPRPGQSAPDTGASREPGDDEDDEGRGAAIIASATGDGSRNQDAPVIVGILARPRACPEDFVRACLELLAEYLAGRNAHADEIRAESERWHHLLTRGPRDVHFATEVVETWLEVRGDGTRMRNPPAKLVASVWKVCDRREEGNAGAEDFGYGPPLGLVQAGIPAPVFTPMPEETADNVTAPASEPSVPYPPPSAEQAAAAVAASRVDAPRWRGGIDPATYALTLGECYTREDLQRDLLREPIEIAQVFPAVDFSTGYPSNEPSRSAKPVYFGWGEHMNSAKRGLSSGEFLAVGAASAGAGKTTFIGWLVNGLALATAARLLGHADFADAPLVLPVWVSEMPKKMEIYGRLASSYLGFDMACLDLGPRAFRDDKVQAYAGRVNMTPHEVVHRARAMEELHGNDNRFAMAFARHYIIRQIVLAKLPRHSRRGGVVVHHRSGPDLVDHLADAVDMHRSNLAELAGVTADKVLPVIVIDPLQRFAGEGESEKRAIDAILGAANDVLCGELDACVITTNDTTKAAARGVSLEHFLSAEAPALMADIFAGSQAIMHHASDVIAVHPERSKPDSPHLTTQWARLLKSRSSGEPPVAFPYTWDKSLGRLTAKAPEPLRDAPAQSSGDRRGRDSGPSRPLGSAPAVFRPPRFDGASDMQD